MGIALEKFQPSAEHKRRPYMIQRFTRELHSALERAAHPLRARIRGVPLHDGRRRRREMYCPRLQAVALVLEAFVYHMDVVSLVVGRSLPTPEKPDGEFLGVRLDTIAELTGLEARRVDRAMRDIHAAGFITSHRRAEKLTGGEYRGHTSIRQLSIELFYAVGMGALFERLRSKAYRRRVDRKAFQAAAHTRLAAKARDFELERREREAPGALHRIGELLERYKKPPS